MKKYISFTAGLKGHGRLDNPKENTYEVCWHCLHPLHESLSRCPLELHVAAARNISHDHTSFTIPPWTPNETNWQQTRWWQQATHLPISSRASCSRSGARVEGPRKNAVANIPSHSRAYTWRFLQPGTLGWSISNKDQSNVTKENYNESIGDIYTHFNLLGRSLLPFPSTSTWGKLSKQNKWIPCITKVRYSHNS